MAAAELLKLAGDGSKQKTDEKPAAAASRHCWPLNTPTSTIAAAAGLGCTSNSRR